MVWACGTTPTYDVSLRTSESIAEKNLLIRILFIQFPIFYTRVIQDKGSIKP